MEQRRQVTRRDPIIIETSQGEFVAKPVPWRMRNDLGDGVIQSYIDSTNEFLGAFKTGPDGKLIGGVFDDKAFDWNAVLALAFPDMDHEVFDKLDIWEMREVLLASLEVNDLESIKHMIDPNSPAPEPMTKNTEVGSGAEPDGQKTISSEDSGDQVTAETKSSS